MLKNSSFSWRAGLAAFLLGAALVPSPGWSADSTYHEPFRPQFHFSPPRNWMNDPNGLVFHDGVYHLFYQYNPQGDKWGHMSWGHATSRDLFHWENQPLALPEKDGVMIFSGSAVADEKNTSGLGKDGKGPLVAIYTGAREKTGGQDKHQDQRLAYSNDEGRTWTQYSGNPVLDLGMADFRDPKVFWHEVSGKWIMATVLATEHKVRLFSSPDLKHWTVLSDFGPAGAMAGLWECPDLFPLAVEGDASAKKWVLLVSINPGGPTGGSGSQYFVGDFDGTHFVADPIAAQPQKEAAPATTPEGKVFADFEGSDYAGWTISGTAFGNGPSHNTNSDLTGYVGKGYVDSFGTGDADTGKITSPPFKVESPQISFLMGGGSHPGQTGMNLIVDGKAVRTSTGNNSAHLEAQSWDVSEFTGRTATLEIFDSYDKDDWGHIFVDQIVFGAGQPTASAPDSSALWVDYGSDYYAGVTWSGIPSADGRRILLGWMSNWAYGQDVPTSPWRSAMTIPRLLSLRKTDAGLHVVQYPVAELQSLRKGALRKFDGGSFTDAAAWLAAQKDLPATLSVELSFSNVSEQTPFVLNLHAGPNEVTAITCDPAKATITVDRTHAGVTNFHHTFAAKHTAPLRVPDGRLSLRLVLDTSSLELFAQDGEAVLTDCIFQTGATRQIELSTTVSDTPAVNTITISTLTGSMAGASPANH